MSMQMYFGLLGTLAFLRHADKSSAKACLYVIIFLNFIVQMAEALAAAFK